MVATYLAPTWFFGYDVALELLFAAITLIVSIFAFKIYKTTNLKQIKLFGISFAFISISYIAQAFFTLLLISEANENAYRVLTIQSIIWFETLGLYAHIFFKTIGLAILVYMSCKTPKVRVLWLLLVTSLLAIFLSSSIIGMFFLISTIYLLFLAWHFINNYLEKKRKQTLLVASAFIFMLFGSIHFIISINHQLFYAIGHILDLTAYLLILFNFYLVRKK